MTTLEPGASVVFTQGLRDSPRSTAFLASSAAPTITDGFDVFVHEVMAAITTEPWSMAVSVPSSRVTGTGFDARGSASTATGSEAGNVPSTPLSRLTEGTYDGSTSRNAVFASASAIRSCGRFGPAIDGTTVPRSRVSSSEYRGDRDGSCHSPCSFAYASTRAT